MSVGLSPDDALQMIPQLSGKKFRWQELKGGLTNRSYRVDTADRSYVLRMDEEFTATFGLDRVAELKAHELAFKAGIAAEIVFADLDSGILFSEFLPGKVWTETDLEDRKNLIALAGLMRKVHALPLLGVSFDANEVAKRYADSLVDKRGLQASAATRVQIVSRLPVTDTFKCCHNDIIAKNVVAGKKLKLLDWEYACDNDPMYDLASVIVYNLLDSDQTDVLLSAYAGGTSPLLFEQLEIQIQLFDAIQWLWFAARN